jgi:hypothetical protein
VPIADIRAEVTVSRHEKLLDETEAATVTNLDSKQIERLPAARRSQLTDIVTPFVSSAVAGHDNFVHLRGNELSLNTFVNGVSSLTIRTSYSRRAFPRTSFNRSIFLQVVFQPSSVIGSAEFSTLSHATGLIQTATEA